MTKEFAPTEKTRLRRRPQRGSYDREVVFAILDAGFVCHLAYAVDGQPFCTPTAYWREGERLYWHGSAGSRMQEAQASDIPVCLTVSHIDGLVLGRSGFKHSILYRSVMVFGCPSPVTDRDEKRRHMNTFIDRLYPGRPQELRAIYDAEIDAISMVGMTIEEVSAKIRDGGVLDPESELNAPCWAGVVRLAPTVGEIVPDAQLHAGIPRSPSLADFTPGAHLGEVLLAHARRQAR